MDCGSGDPGSIPGIILPRVGPYGKENIYKDVIGRPGAQVGIALATLPMALGTRQQV